MIGLLKVMKTNWKVALFYSVVALVILGPLLGPGYILTLDMVFTPNLAMPEMITSSYLFHAGLHVLNLVIPSDIIEKMLLFTVLLLSGLGMHRLMRSLRLPAAPASATAWAAYASGLLYMIQSLHVFTLYGRPVLGTPWLCYRAVFYRGVVAVSTRALPQKSNTPYSLDRCHQYRINSHTRTGVRRGPYCLGAGRLA